jgi:hypothetical protein
MAQNLTTRLPAVGATRQAETANADWDGGMNPGSCMPGVGINTGEYGCKVGDWPNSDFNGTNAIPYDGLSQWLGGVDADGFTPTEGLTTRLALVEPVDGNDTLAFVTADGATAPDAVMNAATGAVNRTGQTVPAGERAWGTVPVA